MGRLDEGLVKRPGFLVIIGGLVTTGLVLFGIAWFRIEPLGFYVMPFIPVGAIFIGALCGSGYGIALLAKGVRVGGGLLAVIVVLQVIAYLAGQVITWHHLEPRDLAGKSVKGTTQTTALARIPCSELIVRALRT